MRPPISSRTSGRPVRGLDAAFIVAAVVLSCLLRGYLLAVYGLLFAVFLGLMLARPVADDPAGQLLRRRQDLLAAARSVGKREAMSTRLADGGVDDTALVNAVARLTGLGIAHGELDRVALAGSHGLVRMAVCLGAIHSMSNLHSLQLGPTKSNTAVSMISKKQISKSTLPSIFSTFLPTNSTS